MASSEDRPLNSGIEDYSVSAILEALLLSSDEPLSPGKIREIIPEFRDVNVRKLVDELNQTYEETGRAFRIEAISDGYQIFTLPVYAPFLEKLHARRQLSRLSSKALETLAIVAYRQPITRHEIEEIRGVNVDGVIKTLLTRNLITIVGTANSPGNPFIYKTTRQFLEYFGFKNISELPKLKELDEIVEADTEIKERFGEEFLKEITPEILGMMENGKSEENEEREKEHPE
jgi:segregation and condensation protein B